MPEYPARKPNRLPGFDYAQNGAYFVTVCTKGKEPFLWVANPPACETYPVGATTGRPPSGPPSPYLSAIGVLAEQAIWKIPEHYPAVTVTRYAVMPNHVHFLLEIEAGVHGRAMHAPTISRIVQHWKGNVSKAAGGPLWQKSFHDHVIRGAAGYQMIWNYIDSNPATWRKDCFYIPIHIPIPKENLS